MKQIIIDFGKGVLVILAFVYAIGFVMLWHFPSIKLDIDNDIKFFKKEGWEKTSHNLKWWAIYIICTIVVTWLNIVSIIETIKFVVETIN